MTIDFSASPYNDDYDETKNFHRIMFKPGLAVQARELTQLQTALQKQIERHGSAIFKDGVAVVGGEFTYTQNLDSVKLESTLGANQVEDYVDQLVGQTIIGSTTGIKAEVITYTPATDTDKLTLFVQYKTTGNDTVTTTYGDGEALYIAATQIGDYVASEHLATTATDNSAVGSSCSIKEGIYYVKGNFVYVPAHLHIISKYDNQISKRLGLDITESIVTSVEDQSLLDNANGSTNYAAIGADRYVIELKLASYELADDINTAKFIELESIDTGTLVSPVRKTEYSVLGENLARRTADTNGDAITAPFSFEFKESLNNHLNQGVYDAGTTTDDGATTDESLMAIQIGQGKAYVSGFELETVGTTVLDIPKPRDAAVVTGATTGMEVGNYIRVKNNYGLLDTEGNGAIVDYPEVNIYSEQTVTPGVGEGTLIGTARARSVEFDSGTADGTVDSFTDEQLKIYLFDLKMFTSITVSAIPLLSQIPEGTFIKGSLSGATGYVHSTSPALSGGVKFVLSGVSGSFQPNENLISNNSYEANSYVTNTGTPVTVNDFGVKAFNFEQAKQIQYDDATINYSGDIVLAKAVKLSGTVSIGAAGTTLNGFGTRFVNNAFVGGAEVEVGDKLLLPTGTAGADEERIIATITDGGTLTLETPVTNAVTSVGYSAVRASLIDQDKNISVRKLNKEYTKAVTNADVTIRRQFLATTDASGSFTLNSVTGGKFNVESNLDYQMTVLVPGVGGSAVAGDLINIDSDEVTFSASGLTSITITSLAILGDGAEVKINATMLRSAAAPKSKINNVVKAVRVLTNDGDSAPTEVPYGTRVHHDEISLGVADAWKLLAVYDSGDPAAAAVTNTIDYNNPIGAFTVGEQITGDTSGAVAIIVNNTSPLQYIQLTDIQFVVGESITGVDSAATGDITGVNIGSSNVTSKYTLDSGQRDNFYDISRIALKKRASKPVGELLVIFNYFGHSAGDFFNVESYSTVDYKDIPYYSSTRIDTEVENAKGKFDLRSVVDYRSRVADATTAVLAGSAVPAVTGRSFDFESRNYLGTGSSVSATPKDNSNFNYDYEYYLGRRDSLWLTATGEFKLVSGISAEVPVLPANISNAMKLIDITMPPYVLNIKDVTYKAKVNKQYRMDDIAKLEDRINNIEYYTTLSLLESSADRLQIKDINGLDRFKSGFLVDNFKGHRTGDVSHEDYRCAIDMRYGILRTKYTMKNVELQESTLDDAVRTAAGYVVNNDIATLTYTEVLSIDQPYATRVENVNPVYSSTWAGEINLVPSSDNWFDATYAPQITIENNGDYDAVVAEASDSLGYVWGATETSWSGISTSSDTETAVANISDINLRTGIPSVQTTTRTTETQTATTTISGINTSILSNTQTTLFADRILTNDLVPYMRHKHIYFTGSGFRPNTRVYPFFDKTNVSNYTKPSGGTVLGTIVPTAVTLGGGWDEIDQIKLTNLWAHHHGAENKTILVEMNTVDSENGWTTVHTEVISAPRAKSDLVISGLNFTPSNTGEVFIRVSCSPGEHWGFREIECYELGEFVPITRTLYQVSSVNNIRDIGQTLKDNQWVGASSVRRRSTVNSANSELTKLESAYRTVRHKYDDQNVTYKIVNGVKTELPTNGTIYLVDNDTINGDALVSDSRGNVSGVFTIPNPNLPGRPKFTSGESTFRLTSSPVNSVSDVITSGDVVYTSRGYIQTRQNVYISTRTATIVRTPITLTFDKVIRNTTESVSATIVNGEVVIADIPVTIPTLTTTNEITGRSTLAQELVNNGTVDSGWVDPLAQSFVVTTKGGEFLTKVGLYFSAKDNEIPVKIQLREMINGYPSAKIIPGSTVVLNSDAVSISAAGNIITEFDFDAPVFVKEGAEIALVVLSDSDKYLAYTSKLGETNIADDKVVSKQPYLGVLFKSQNASTWTAYDSEDLKFTLFRAKFDINTPATVTLEGAGVDLRQLETDPIEMFAGSSVVKVRHPDHHMYNTGNYVEIAGVSTGIASTLDAAIAPGDLTLTFPYITGSGMPTSGVHTFKITVTNEQVLEEEDNYHIYEVITGTVSEAGGTITLSTITRGVENAARDFLINEPIELYETNGVSFENINTFHTIVDYGMDYYTVDLGAGNEATLDTKIGGKYVAASHNAIANSYQIMVPTVTHDGTSITTNLTMATATSASGTETSFAASGVIGSTPNDLHHLTQPTMVMSDVNINKVGNQPTNVVFTLTTKYDNVSPVIDLERTSITTFANRLDNIVDSSDVFPTSEYIAPTSPEGDSGEGVYITKRVELKNPATAINVYADIVRYASANVQVMYKTLRSDDSTNFDDVSWSYFNTDGSPDVPVNATTNGSLLEYAYSVDSLPEFISFAIKIKMNGTNACEVPLIKDLRAIAIAV